MRERCPEVVPLGEGVVPIEKLLPRVGYVQAIADLANSNAWRGKPVPMSLCVGPALKWAKLNAILLWAATLLSCAVSYFLLLECVDGRLQQRKTLAGWLLYAGLVTIIFPVGTCLEFVCLRYTTIPFVQVTQGFKLLGARTPFCVWVGVALVQSSLGKADMLTDGGFVARLMRQEQCSEGRLAEVWEISWQAAGFPSFAHFRIWQVGLALYLLTLGQCIWPLLQSVPVSSEREAVDYCIQPASAAPGSKHLHFRFTNLVGERVRLGDVIMMLAEAGAMNSLMMQSPAYPMVKAEEEPQKALTLAGAAVSRGVVSCGLSAVLENGLQLLLQISIFAMEDFLMGGYSTVGLISMGLSIIMLSIKLKDAHTLLRFSSQARSQASGEAVDSDEFRHLLKYTRILQLMVLLLLLTIAYGVAQLVAVVVCRDSVWTLQGCVDLGALRGANAQYVKYS